MTPQNPPSEVHTIELLKRWYVNQRALESHTVRLLPSFQKKGTAFICVRILVLYRAS